MSTLGEDFDPKRNSLNFLRLVLAFAVLVSHSVGLGGFRWDWPAHTTGIGTIAVYGFFGLSGFLIAGSAQKHGTGRYLWQRFLRIMPAFWVCLIVTAFGFATLAWLHTPGHGSSWSYLTESDGPVGYVFHNSFLRINQPEIQNTLTGQRVGPAWNGSLWTLSWEFLCYLILGLLAAIGLMRRWLVLALAVMIWMAEVIVTSVPSLNHQVNGITNNNVLNFIELVPIFMIGAAIYLHRDHLPDSGWLALGSGIAFLSGFVLPLGGSDPAFTLTSMNLTAVFAVYPLLWLGVHLPFHRIGARNDYSYGIYIYAFPIQQLLVMWGVAAWGFVPYTASTIVLTGCAAAASWWLIEKRTLRLKSWTPRLAMRAALD